ncbi:MAG: tetratricopeptide repeat protein [Anaerolineae bacterium]|nr:tetratricopeptide repeat protein [Anaerolineae bacterium]
MTKSRIIHRIAAAALGTALFIAGAPAFAQSGCDTTINHIRAGSEFYAAGNYQAAYTSFSCFLELYPVEAYPEQTAEALNMLGNVRREQGDLEAAIDQYTQAIEVQDDLAIAYNNRGWAYFNLGEYEEALADYDAALAHDSNLGYAYNNRGLIHQYRGELGEAASDFEHAITLGAEPTPWAQYNLSLVRLVEGRQGNSLTPAMPSESTSTTTTNDTRLASLLSRGETAHADGDWRATIDVMSDAIAINDRADRAFYLRGRAYIALDNPDAAFADFDRLVELRPQFAYAYWERAVAYAELGNFDAAVADADFAARMIPGHVNNFIVRGTIASLTGDTAKAGEEFLGTMLCLERERIESEAIEIDTTIGIDMTQGRIYAIPFEGEEGQTIDIVVTSATADPVISLLAPDGSPINGDDDSGFMLGSLIEDFTLDADGTYTLMVSHAGGGSYGRMTVAILNSADAE